MTLLDFVARHPYRVSLGFLVIIVAVLVLLGIANSVFLMGNLVQLALGDLILAGIGIVLLTRLGWWEKAGYTTGIRPAHLPLFILPVVVALLALGDGIRVTEPLALLAFAGLTLVVGFAEETFFRGLILTALLPTGILRAVIASSGFFAALHLLNTLGGVWDPYFTAADIVAALGIGITFAALRLRTGSILPLIGIHALIDFCSLISIGGIDVPEQSFSSLLTTFTIGIVFVAYGLFLLRHEIRIKSAEPGVPVVS